MHVLSHLVVFDSLWVTKSQTRLSNWAELDCSYPDSSVYGIFQFCSVQSLSRVQSLWLHELQHARPPCPSPTPGVWPKLMSTESVMPSNHLLLCHPLLLLPSVFLNIRVFSNKSALLIKWPKYWGFSFNISPSNEHPGLISFRME